MSRLEILPRDIQARVGATFEISARAYDAQGHIVSPGTMTWTISGAHPSQLDLVGVDGPRAMLAAKHSEGTPLKITAAAGAASVIVTAMVVPSTIGSTEAVDVVEAPHQSASPLALALLTGKRTAPVKDEVLAFAAGARVENLEGDGSFAVFSPDRRAFHTDVADWRSDQLIQTAPDGTGTEPVAVKVSLWDATNDGLTSFNDLDVARLVFRINRTGVTFEPAGGSAMPVRLAPASVVTENCESPEDVFGSVFDPSLLALHVFVVESVEGLHGWTCRASTDPDRKARAIFLAVTRNTTTLAHEMGHVMALLEPAGGHSECAGGFDESNLMWRFLSDQQSGNRLELSLGQVFRIATDKRSWVTTSGLGAIVDAPDCGMLGAPCPLLSLPVKPPDVFVAPSHCLP